MSMEQNLDGDIILENNIEVSTNSIVQAIIANPTALQEIARAIVALNTYKARNEGNLLGTVAQRKERPRAIQPNTQQRVY